MIYLNSNYRTHSIHYKLERLLADTQSSVFVIIFYYYYVEVKFEWEISRAPCVKVFFWGFYEYPFNRLLDDLGSSYAYVFCIDLVFIGHRVTELKSDRLTDTQGYSVCGWVKFFCD